MRERLRRLGLVVATAAAFVPTMQATAASAELHKNPSAETLSRGTPVNWSKSTWGTNTTTLKTTRAAHTGAVAMSVATTKYKSGAANWFQRVPVTAGKSYAFGVWYKSTVVTQLVAEFKLATGKVTYASLGSLTASSAYKRAGATFTAPAGAASVAIYLPLAAVGYRFAPTVQAHVNPSSCWSCAGERELRRRLVQPISERASGIERGRHQGDVLYHR
jgi:hypothetical protein